MFPFSGESRCLHAFTVALSEACNGGVKRWYASTLELQLVSLEFCRACRSIPQLAVNVEASTPRSLWSPRKAQTPPRTRSSEARSASRVPVVQAVRLTWGLPAEILMEDAAMEYWAMSEYLRLGGSVSAASLSSPVWPASLQQLSFGQDFYQPIEGVVWPSSLQQLSFGYFFNKPIAGVVWPASLQQLMCSVMCSPVLHKPMARAQAVLQSRLFDAAFFCASHGFHKPVLAHLFHRPVSQHNSQPRSQNRSSGL